MLGPRIKIIIEVNTDAVPGWGHNPEDFVEFIRYHLANSIPHYKPEVTLDNGDNSEEGKQVPLRSTD